MKTNKKTFAKKNERGQSLVELAISLIAILTLLAGAVDFGIALYSYVSIRDAAQEGALYGSINPTNTTEIENRVRTASAAPVDLQNDTDVDVTITILPTGAVACEGNGAMVQVEVSYDYILIMPILPQILGISKIPLNASVTDAILQPVCP